MCVFAVDCDRTLCGKEKNGKVVLVEVNIRNGKVLSFSGSNEKSKFNQIVPHCIFRNFQQKCKRLLFLMEDD